MIGGEEAKPQITSNDIIKIFRKEGLFTRQRYRRMKDQKPGPGLAYNLDFAKKEDLNLNVKRFPKLSKVGDVVNKLVYSKRITDRGLKAAG